VGLFEREHDGTFRQPSRYPEKAIVTFNTHDLPTFAGWKSSHDLKVRAALGQDPGETEDDRQAARHAMRATLAEQGLGPQLTLIDVLRYLARTRSQLLAVSLEDILGLLDQSNVPGTITEHPNWRRRLPCDINALTDHETLRSIAKVMAAEGRACAKVAGALTSDGILPT
jgi:4-alpha-glucanotransferase